jgi:hypothetical protein
MFDGLHGFLDILKHAPGPARMTSAVIRKNLDIIIIQALRPFVLDTIHENGDGSQESF